jgi:hypothetical protein
LFTSPYGITLVEKKEESIERIEFVIKEKERIYSIGTNVKSEMEKIIDEYILYYIPESIANSIQASYTEPPLPEDLSNKVIDGESVPEEDNSSVSTETNGLLSETVADNNFFPISEMAMRFCLSVKVISAIISAVNTLKCTFSALLIALPFFLSFIELNIYNEVR